MTSFDELNPQIVYTEVKSKKEAIELRTEAQETARATGKCVVIFFDDRYHQYLAPGLDPYQIRSEITEWQNKQNKSSVTKKTTTSSKSSGSASRLSTKRSS